MGQEAVRNWSAIIDKNFEFNTEEKLIQAIEKVTIEDLEKLYKTLIFENPKRINLRMYSHEHLKNKEQIEESEVKNMDFYKEHCPDAKHKLIENYNLHKKSHPTYPRL